MIIIAAFKRSALWPLVATVLTICCQNWAWADTSIDRIPINVRLHDSLFEALESEGVDTENISRSWVSSELARQLTEAIAPIVPDLLRRTELPTVEIHIRLNRNQLTQRDERRGFSIFGLSHGPQANLGFQLSYQPQAFLNAFFDDESGDSILSEKVKHLLIVDIIQMYHQHYLWMHLRRRFALDPVSLPAPFEQAYSGAITIARMIRQYAFSQQGAVRATAQWHLNSRQDQTQILQFFADLRERGLIPPPGQIELAPYANSYRRIISALLEFVAATNRATVIEAQTEQSKLVLLPFLQLTFAEDYMFPEECEAFLSPAGS